MNAIYYEQETRHNEAYKRSRKLQNVFACIHSQAGLKPDDVLLVQKIFQKVRHNIVNKELIGTLYVVIAYTVKQLRYDAPLNIKNLLEAFDIKINTQELKMMQIMLLEQIDFELY